MKDQPLLVLDLSKAWSAEARAAAAEARRKGRGEGKEEIARSKEQASKVEASTKPYKEQSFTEQLHSDVVSYLKSGYSVAHLRRQGYGDFFSADDNLKPVSQAVREAEAKTKEFNARVDRLQSSPEGRKIKADLDEAHAYVTKREKEGVSQQDAVAELKQKRGGFSKYFDHQGYRRPKYDLYG